MDRFGDIKGAKQIEEGLAKIKAYWDDIRVDGCSDRDEVMYRAYGKLCDYEQNGDPEEDRLNAELANLRAREAQADERKMGPQELWPGRSDLDP